MLAKRCYKPGLSPSSQLPDDRRQQPTSRFFGFAAAGQLLRDLHKHLADAMIGRDFRDHLAVVGRGAEDSRVTWNRRDRLTLNGLGEFARGDFRPLGHADLAEAIERWPVVGPRRLEQTQH